MLSVLRFRCFILPKHLCIGELYCVNRPMAPQKNYRKRGGAKHLKNHGCILCQFPELLDYFQAMLDTGQPGELPLMRELIALKRARSLRDPSTVKLPDFENVPVVSNPNRKPPVRGYIGRSSETGKASSGKGHNVGGQLPGSSHARRATGKNALPVTKASPSHKNDNDPQVTWDLGLEEIHPSSERHQPDVFGGVNRKSPPKSGEYCAHKSTGDVNDDEYSLQNWTNVRWNQEEVPRREQIQSVDERGIGIVEVPSMKGGSSSRIGDAFEFKNPATLKKSPFNNKGSNLRRDTNTKQSSQILSPLTLNSHDESLYGGGHHLSMFSLEGPLYDEQEHWNQGFKTGSVRALSQSGSALSREQIGRPGLGTAVKTSWQSQDLLTSSSHTSQRTLSQVSLPGDDDELDVSELPRNGCGMPCHWSKGKRRSKSIAKSSSDPPRKKGGTSPKGLIRSRAETCRESAADVSKQPFRGEKIEAAPLLTEPSPVSDNDRTSSTEERSQNTSDLNGELGLGDQAVNEGSKSLNPDFQEEAVCDCTTLDGRELAVFVERPRSLSQKYRPRTFEELIGQHLVANALSNAITRGKVAPVYLFQGSRGTGKTSAARIFAAALNCVTSGDRKPCGVCSECMALSSGKMPAVQEIDGASHNGIENVKALLLSAFAANSGSGHKVFIIDECHMLTNETWNALLKLLEEPPRNAVVILITTDPDKLPRTAVSRCQKFIFPKIKQADIVNRLENLVKLENLDVEPGALELIASKSEGSLRDAETVLDQLSLLGQRITLGTIHELIGSVSDDKLLGLLDLALCSDTVSTVRKARELIDSGVEPLDLMSQLATLITDILAGSYEIMNRVRDRGFFSRHALNEVEMERLRTALKILSEAEKQLRAASKDRTTWLTAALLRFGPDRPTKFAVSSTSTSLTPSPIIRSGRTGKKVNEPKAYRLRRDTRKRSLPKGTISTHERRSHGSVIKGASRALKSGYEVRVHPTDQSSPHDASREFSTESSVAESPFSSEGIERHASFKSPGNLGSIWWNVLGGCGSIPLRQLLQYHGKLLAVSFSAVNAVAHLEFAKPEYKHRAERYRKSIATSFKKVLGLPVEVKISLASLPSSSGFACGRMWAPATTSEAPHMQSALEQYTKYLRTESGNLANDRNNPEVGSLRHWRGQSGVSSQKTLEQTNAPYTFPAIPSLSSGTVTEPRPMSRRSDRIASFKGPVQSRYGPEAPVHEGHRLETAWRQDGRDYSPLQFFKYPQQKPSVLKDFGGNSQHLDLFSEKIKFSRNDLNKTADGLHAQKYEHGVAHSNEREDDVFQAYSVEEENLTLESRMKYGGLLCWKAPKMEQEKANKQRRRRKNGILIRLMPCVRFKGRS